MIEGKNLVQAAVKYLGRSYSEMDCQAFPERALKDCGININLAGSNAWYREVMKNGAVMTPEECVRKLGNVPPGAFLFIWANDGGEEKRGYHDGLGNASHMGFCTDETAEEMMAYCLAQIGSAAERKWFIEKVSHGNGAIHSSSSRGCVCTSKFAGKTIPNGGWNRVGLWTKEIAYDYTGGDSGFPDNPGWHPTIRRGSKGTDVAYVQAILQQLGYDLGSAGVDGDFGRKTEEAVIAFQKKNGLIADGVVGPMTYEALEHAEPEKDDGDRWTVIIPDVTTEEKDSLLAVFTQATAEKGRG